MRPSIIAISLVGLAAGSQVFDDSSVLLQQEFGPKAGICSDAQLAEFKEKKDEHAAKVKALMLSKVDKLKDKVQGIVDEGSRRGADTLAPMLDAVESVGKYLKAEAEPTGIKSVKSVLQILFKGDLVPAEKMIDLNATTTAFVKRWDSYILGHVKDLLLGGFAQLTEKIEKALEVNVSKTIRAHIPDVAPPKKDLTEAELRKYVEQKAVPVLVWEAYPSLHEAAEMLANAPTDPKDQAAWSQKTLMPWLMKFLPAKCQPTKLITTLTLGFGDIGSRITKFIDTCKKDLGISDGSEPTRKCQTCEEVYTKTVTEIANPNGCMLHCMPIMASCKQLNDACLHKISPCLRCHGKKLEKLDECRGTDKAAKLAEALGSLSLATKSGSIEKAGVSSFLEQVLDSVMPKV